VETVNVYWAYLTTEQRSTLLNLMWEPPRLLLQSLPPKGTSNYTGCKAVSTYYNNSYVLYHAVNSSVVPSTLKDGEYGLWDIREGSFQNSYTVDYDHAWVFFAEEPVVIELTPPYMHQTVTSHYGHITAGAYDISQWFRPLTLTYQLWQDQNYLEVKKGEAAAYFHFHTNKKVVLRQFEMSDEIRSIAFQSVELKQVLPNLPLTDLYSRFTRSKRDKNVLRLIKERLL
jgi:hypothetical protein